ncbi:MAG: hypothetical protein ACD_8C00017G0001 [uncultured bacterium]|nr:MAG: hypothetical protein ACD_8C00017G0001 [uncultured bacterium]
MMGRYGDWGYGQMMGYGFGSGWILTLLFWALIIWAIYALIKHVIGKNDIGLSSKNQEDSAIKILKDRYAKGEINKEEFDQKKKDLENKE